MTTRSTRRGLPKGSPRKTGQLLLMILLLLVLLFFIFYVLINNLVF